MAATLTAIRTKIRRLTRSLSEAQLSTDQIDEYINTFVLYDFPEHLRLFNLRTTFSFYTEPYIDTYETSTDAASLLFNFKNKYITVHPPVYIGGYESWFSEDRTSFFNAYPKFEQLASIGFEGDGVTTAFAGFISGISVASPTGNQTVILRNKVLFNSIDAFGNGLSLVDYPVSATTGALGLLGAPQVLPSPYGSIDYTTGAFSVNFSAAPASGKAINSQVVIVKPSRPNALLFFNDIFTVRPVPDQVYKIQMEVYARPTELLAADQEPHLQEWWQYIAFSAAKKVFEDRMDYESLNTMMPSLKEQEKLITRRTIVQQTSQRTPTIYTGQLNQSGSGWFGSGGIF